MARLCNALHSGFAAEPLLFMKGFFLVIFFLCLLLLIAICNHQQPKDIARLHKLPGSLVDKLSRLPPLTLVCQPSRRDDIRYHIPCCTLRLTLYYARFRGEPSDVTICQCFGRSLTMLAAPPINQAVVMVIQFLSFISR